MWKIPIKPLRFLYMLLDRKKLVETSYFFIADIVEGLDTSLAYARSGFIPNFKNLDDLEGKHSEQQTRLAGDGASDIWTEEWSKFWEGKPIHKFEDAVKESEAERNRRYLEEDSYTVHVCCEDLSSSVF